MSGSYLVTSRSNDDHNHRRSEDNCKVGDDRRRDIEVRRCRSGRVVRVPAGISKFLEHTHIPSGELDVIAVT